MLYKIKNSVSSIYDRILSGSLMIHLRYWWYRKDHTRLLVFLFLTVILITVSAVIRQSVRAQTALKEINCLALNVYYEARGEPEAGQYAVAEVTMNRVKSRRYPDTVCQVVYEKRWDAIRNRYVSAFSWTEIENSTVPDNRAWQAAKIVANDTYSNKVSPRLNGAVYYHARSIRPSWSKTQTEVARIGRHIFYR